MFVDVFCASSMNLTLQEPGMMLCVKSCFSNTKYVCDNNLPYSFGNLTAMLVSHSHEPLQPCSATEVGINFDRDARGKSCLLMLETYCYSLRRATVEMNPK